MADQPNVNLTSGTDGLSFDEIARRAYELYQRRGGAHGQEHDDWLEAERQLREERQRTAGAGSSDGTASASTAAASKKSAAKKAPAKKSAAKKSGAKKSAAKQSGNQG